MQSNFCKERNWDQYHIPRNLLLAMIGEVGEVSELLYVHALVDIYIL